MFIAIKFKAEKCLRPCESKFLIAVTQGFIRNKLRSVGCQLLKVSVEGECEAEQSVYCRSQHITGT